jgi:hypothetical protein
LQCLILLFLVHVRGNCGAIKSERESALQDVLQFVLVLVLVLVQHEETGATLGFYACRLALALRNTDRRRLRINLRDFTSNLKLRSAVMLEPKDSFPHACIGAYNRQHTNEKVVLVRSVREYGWEQEGQFRSSSILLVVIRSNSNSRL